MKHVFYKFDHRINRPEPHIVALLSEIEGMRGEFTSGLRMIPEAVMNLKRSTLITSAGASTRIEGSRLSDLEVEKIMRGLFFSKFADRDVQEVQGYLETLQNVFDSYETLSLREGIIQGLHKQLLKYSVKDERHRGDYKKKENTVGIVGPDGKVLHVMFQTTPAYLTPKEMQELVDYTNHAFQEKRFHPILIISNFIIEFLKIHPFEDGNGRLSRVLSNLLLLKFGYLFTHYVSHEQIIERRKDEYYLALRKSQKTFKTKEDTISPWLNFFFSVLQEQGKKAISYLDEEQIQDILSPKQTAVLNYLSKASEAAPSEVVKATGVALGTVRQSLDCLVKRGLLKRVGRGRATRYVKI